MTLLCMLTMLTFSIVTDTGKLCVQLHGLLCQ